MIALFSFSSAFFPQKGAIFLSPFIIKFKNQSVKHYIVNCLKAIFAIKAFKIKRSSKKYTFKKIKDFVGYGCLNMLYKPIYRPSKYIFPLC